MKTINQIVDLAKAGTLIPHDECVQAMLALHSMLIQSRMSIEMIASHIGNETNTHAAARGLFGNLQFVQDEKNTWLNSNPQAWLLVNKTI